VSWNEIFEQRPRVIIKESAVAALGTCACPLKVTNDDGIESWIQRFNPSDDVFQQF
jgi:hypothetical protein